MFIPRSVADYSEQGMIAYALAIDLSRRHDRRAAGFAACLR
jgi:hypothetical protein